LRSFAPPQLVITPNLTSHIHLGSVCPVFFTKKLIMSNPEHGTTEKQMAATSLRGPEPDCVPGWGPTFRHGASLGSLREPYKTSVISSTSPSLKGKILCCFKGKPKRQYGRESLGAYVTTLDGQTQIHKIGEEVENQWNTLKLKVDDIIRRTPTKSEAEATPIVMVHGFMKSVSEGPSIPVVVISSSSDSYATHLQKTIQSSGILKGTGFSVEILYNPRPVAKLRKPTVTRNTPVMGRGALVVDNNDLEIGPRQV
jgi:hypothetical protein